MHTNNRKKNLDKIDKKRSNLFRWTDFSNWYGLLLFSEVELLHSAQNDNL